MGWFFRVVELANGRGWACRFGRQEYDVHLQLAAALAHIRQLATDQAATYSPAQIVLHRLDGTVQHLGAV